MNVFHRCEKHGKAVCWFCIGNTVGFPLEHIIWERLPVFSWITYHVLGLK